MMQATKMVDDVTIGADIEVFLQNKDSGEIVTAEGIIKGSKEEPFRFEPSNSFYATSLDNVMAEFCIPPAKTPQMFCVGIGRALAHIDMEAAKHNLVALAIPAAKLSEIYLQTENAKLFGCDPDFDTWTDLQNPPPQAIESNLRTCGGHVHIGYKDSNEMINRMIIKACDIFLGVPSILQEPDNQRKELYGKAGAFRDKSYGVEYRTISNYYLAGQHLTEWVFNNTLAAIDFVNNNGLFNFSYDRGLEIQKCINTGNKEIARDLIKIFNVKLAA